MTVAPRKPQTLLKPIDPASQLVEQASNGCSDSFGQLVELHQQSVRLFVSKFAPCPARVDDIAQEVFLTAYRQLSRFRHEAKFSTWLLGIARNKALVFLRAEVASRKNRNQFFEAEIAKRKISRLENDQKDLERTQERINKLKSCLDQLPSRSKTLVFEYYFDQPPAAETESKSKQSCSTLRMKLLRIRRILRKCMLVSSDFFTQE